MWNSCKHTCSCPNDGRSSGDIAQQNAIISNLKQNKIKFFSVWTWTLYAFFYHSIVLRTFSVFFSIFNINELNLKMNEISLKNNFSHLQFVGTVQWLCQSIAFRQEMFHIIIDNLLIWLTRQRAQLPQENTKRPSIRCFGETLILQ